MSRHHNFNMKDSRIKILASNIKAERNRKGFTQSELSEYINISESSMSLIERGIQTPSIFVVHDIARVLSIDINDLLKDIP